MKLEPKVEHPLLQWLRRADLLGDLETGLEKENDSPIVLQVDAMQAACSSPELGLTLITEPEVVRGRLVAEILAHDVPSCAAARVWLRVTGVPLPLSTVVPGQTVAGNSVPVHFIGICAATSSVGRRISSQVLKCPCCDTVQTVLAGVPRQACCEESSSLSCAQWEEDMSGRTFVPVQQMWFTAVQRSFGPRAPSAHVMSVHLAGENLCGKAAIGSCAVIFGCTEVTPFSSAWSIGAVQVKANNMSILSPRAAMVAPATSAEWERWQTDILSEPQHTLTNLSEALSVWLQPQPSSASILLAMLLSAVTAGTFPQPTSDIERSQVHILIGCEGHEPGAMRIIQRTLKLLTPQCVFHDENKPLLPKLQPTPLPGVENGVRVDAGSLGLAASGVLLLQHHQLKKKEQDALAHTLEHSSKSVCADPALSVSVTAAVWMIADQKDIRQNCNSKKGRGMSSTSEKTHLSGNLLGAFDLVTSYSTADDMELEAIEHILDFSSEAGTDTDESSLEQMAALGRCMERHMAKAACMQQPTMSTGAANFLQQYFMALRQYDAADFGVTAGTLSSLARLAIASARLHLRDTVLALPDAVLAIIMFERSCDSKGFQSRMARDVQNIVPDGEELADHLRASHTALKAHFGSTDVGLAREE